MYIFYCILVKGSLIKCISTEC